MAARKKDKKEDSTPSNQRPTNKEILSRLKEIEARHHKALTHGQQIAKKRLVELDVLWLVQMLEDKCNE